MSEVSGDDFAAANARTREALLATIESALIADPRVVAAWLAGSIGRGTHDDLSDIDICIAVTADAVDAVIGDPQRFVRAITPTMLEINAPANAPAGGAFVLTVVDSGDSLQQVDWYFSPAASSIRPHRTRPLFEHRPIAVTAPVPPLAEMERERALDGLTRDALSMVFITRKDIRRGDAWRVVRHLDQVDRILGSLVWVMEHGVRPEYSDALRRVLPDRLPGDREGHLAMLNRLLDSLEDLLRTSGRIEPFAHALNRVRSAIR